MADVLTVSAEIKRVAARLQRLKSSRTAPIVLVMKDEEDLSKYVKCSRLQTLEEIGVIGELYTYEASTMTLHLHEPIIISCYDSPSLFGGFPGKCDSPCLYRAPEEISGMLELKLVDGNRVYAGPSECRAILRHEQKRRRFIPKNSLVGFFDYYVDAWKALKRFGENPDNWESC